MLVCVYVYCMFMYIVCVYVYMYVFLVSVEGNNLLCEARLSFLNIPFNNFYHPTNEGFIDMVGELF